MDEIKLTIEQAYRAMFYFLKQKYALMMPDEIEALLASLSCEVTLGDRQADPSIWQDWQDAVQSSLSAIVPAAPVSKTVEMWPNPPMNNILDLGASRLARVWAGALPNAAYPAGEVARHRTNAAVDRIHDGYQLHLAVELFVPAGKRFMYGLLGGVFKSGWSWRDHLAVEVSTSSSSGILITDGFASKLGRVWAGLPVACTDAVFRGIEAAKSGLGDVLPGRLTLDCAAYSATGASDVIYESLADILMRLINRTHLYSNTEVIDLILASLARSVAAQRHSARFSKGGWS